MSTELDIATLKADLVGFKGKTFPIYTEELTALIERLEVAEGKLAQIHEWVSKAPRTVAL